MGYDLLVFENIENSGNWRALIIINEIGGKGRFYPQKLLEGFIWLKGILVILGVDILVLNG